jgi:hypothetical protein
MLTPFAIGPLRWGRKRRLCMQRDLPCPSLVPDWQSRSIGAERALALRNLRQTILQRPRADMAAGS